MVYLPVSGGMKIDHIGVTTADVDAALAGLDPALVRGPFDNIERGVRQAFVRAEGGVVLELLSPLAGMVSPISRHVRGGGGAHHVCFVAPDLAAAVTTATQAGARVVVEPTPDVAFEGRRIAFLVDPLYGLIEFVEAERASPAVEVDDALDEIFTKLFPALQTTGVATARLEATPGWDSLGQIRLIIALEQRFGVAIPSDAIARLVDYRSVRGFLRTN